MERAWREAIFIPFIFHHCAGARPLTASISICSILLTGSAVAIGPFLFTHGHHLDGIQTFTMQLVEKLRRLSGEEFLPADLEMMMTYAYESIYRSAYIGEMVSFEELYLEGLQPAAEVQLRCLSQPALRLL